MLGVPAQLLSHGPIMWCSVCQQDVPAVPVPGDSTQRGCARCHGQLAKRAAADPPAASAEEAASAPFAFDPLRAPPTLDEWDLNHDLATVTRIMQSLRAEGATAASAPPEPRLPTWHATHAAQPLPAPHGAATPPAKRSHWLAWPALMLGVMGFACGAVLLTWSFITGRGDLWTYGLPAILAGQGLLVLGLVLQLEGLWQNTRETRETLRDLDQELAELRHATTLLTSSQSAAGQSFYAHMAEGASPHLLLADVKGQLDLIAARLAQAKGR